MSVLMSIHLFVLMSIHMSAYACTCLYSCQYTCLYVSTHAYTLVYTHVYTHVHVYTHACTHVYHQVRRLRRLVDSARQERHVVSPQPARRGIDYCDITMPYTIALPGALFWISIWRLLRDSLRRAASCCSECESQRSSLAPAHRCASLCELPVPECAVAGRNTGEWERKYDGDKSKGCLEPRYAPCYNCAHARARAHMNAHTCAHARIHARAQASTHTRTYTHRFGGKGCILTRKWGTEAYGPSTTKDVDLVPPPPREEWWWW